MTRRRGVPRAPRRRRGRGLLFVAGWLVLLLAALASVPWRQTRGVEMERALRALEADRAVAEDERVAVLRRIEELRSRPRIVRVARERFGMHVAQDREIIFLPAVSARPVAAESER